MEWMKWMNVGIKRVFKRLSFEREEEDEDDPAHQTLVVQSHQWVTDLPHPCVSISAETLPRRRL